MSEIQLELQILTNQFNNLDKTSAEFQSERKRITMKLEQLRKDFRSMFAKVEHKTGVEPQPIPSDDVTIYFSENVNFFI
jgi:signal transduction protein with GAF and PtsI domain